MKKHLLDYIDKGESGAVRGLRIMAEYFYALEKLRLALKPDVKVVSVFGSARLKPEDREYKTAKLLGRALYETGFAVVTGASKGIMEGANEGVYNAIISEFEEKKEFKSLAEIKESAVFKKKLMDYSIGLKISLPFEKDPNPYLGTMATFHYFMVRKFFFAKISSAFIACEGGWGTRDELFEIMTLVQTGKAPLMPIIYISPTPEHLKNDVAYAVKKGYINPEDKKLIDFVKSYKQAVKIISKFYKYVNYISYNKGSHIQIYLKKELTAEQKARVKKMVSGKNKKVFTGGVKFYKNKFELRNYVHYSYGLVREIIDKL
ncbi:LOG family protein [bacterium]|nr:LOG family protein [bacterium]MBU1916836.1 LOG family protein [bacterium]